MSSTASIENYQDPDSEQSRLVDLSDDATIDLRGTSAVIAEKARDQAAAALQTDAPAGDDVVEGVHDPIFPFVVIGTMTLIAIIFLAAVLAL